jgi:transposase
MRRFVEGADRGQTTLLPECLGDWVEESNPVRAVDVFVEALDLADLGFDGVQPLATGSSLNRPHPPHPRAHRDFTAWRLIRDAFAVRERFV